MQTGENFTKYKFMTFWILQLIPLSLTNCKDFPRSLNGESGRASHLVYKFDKQIARRNNSQMKILNLFEFPHVPAA